MILGVSANEISANFVLNLDCFHNKVDEYGTKETVMITTDHSM